MVSGCDIYQAGQNAPSSQTEILGYVFSHAGRWKQDLSTSRIKREVVKHSQEKEKNGKHSIRGCATQCSKKQDTGDLDIYDRGGECIAFEHAYATRECHLWITQVDDAGNPHYELDASMGIMEGNNEFRAYTRCKPGESLNAQPTMQTR